MERRRFIGWLTAPAAAVVGLLLYGAVLGGIAPSAESDLSPDGQAAPLLRQGAAASLPVVGARRGDRDVHAVDSDAGTDESDAIEPEASESESVEFATAEEEAAFRQSVLNFASLLLPMSGDLRDGRLAGLSVPGQVDYRDFAESGNVPLVEVRGRRDAPLSEHFSVGHFAAKDGAPYARIAPDLVELMDDLTEHFGRRVHINSAYRHPSLNFNGRIDGAAESRHMAGLAADIWVEGHAPFEVAQALVNIRGCRIGLGLGEHYLHVDLRDWAASWTYPGAPLAEADFDLWMIEQCEEFVGESVRQRAVEEKCAKPLTGIEAVEAYGGEMVGLARRHRERRSRGVVLVDVRVGDGRSEIGDGGRHGLDDGDEAAGGGKTSGIGESGSPGTSSLQSETDHLQPETAQTAIDTLERVAAPAVQLAYLPADNALVRLMKLDKLIDRAERNDNFVFVVVDLDGSHRTGLMRYDGTGWSDEDGDGWNPLQAYDEVCAGKLAIAE